MNGTDFIDGGKAMKGAWMILAALLCAAAPSNKPAELINKTKLSLSDALAKVMPDVKEGTPFFVKLKQEKDRVVYSMTFAQGKESVKLSIDAATSEVFGRTLEKKDHSKAILAAKISMAGAIDAALKKVAGKASRANFYLKKGKPMAEVIVVKEGKLFEVKVDAATGAIVKVEEDDDDDDDADDDDDDDDDD
jgi:uncharacterized membrane protein YkoI